jgi:diadenosine tetraphosphate (Ap4A) HIT family hydrolase
MSEVVSGGFVITGCHCCQLVNRSDLPPRDRIYADGRWQVAHAFDSALLGWLILFPVRHLTSLSELTDDEAAGPGILQHGRDP